MDGIRFNFLRLVAAAAAAPGPHSASDLALLSAAVLAAHAVQQPPPHAVRVAPAAAAPAPPLLMQHLGLRQLALSRDLGNVHALVVFLSCLWSAAAWPAAGGGGGAAVTGSLRAFASAAVAARAAIPAPHPVPNVWDLLYAAIHALHDPPGAAAAAAPPPAGGGAAAAAVAALQALHNALPPINPAAGFGAVVAALLASPNAPAQLTFFQGCSLQLVARHAAGAACGAATVLNNLHPGASLLVQSVAGDRNLGAGVVRAALSPDFLATRIQVGVAGPPLRNPACGCPPALGT